VANDSINKVTSNRVPIAKFCLYTRIGNDTNTETDRYRDR